MFVCIVFSKVKDNIVHPMQKMFLDIIVLEVVLILDVNQQCFVIVYPKLCNTHM